MPLVSKQCRADTKQRRPGRCESQGVYHVCTLFFGSDIISPERRENHYDLCVDDQDALQVDVDVAEDDDNEEQARRYVARDSGTSLWR